MFVREKIDKNGKDNNNICHNINNNHNQDKQDKGNPFFNGIFLNFKLLMLLFAQFKMFSGVP